MQGYQSGLQQLAQARGYQQQHKMNQMQMQAMQAGQEREAQYRQGLTGQIDLLQQGGQSDPRIPLLQMESQYGDPAKAMTGLMGMMGPQDLGKVWNPVTRQMEYGTPQAGMGAAAPQGPPGTKAAFNYDTNQPMFATEQQIAESAGRIGPAPSGMKIEMGPDGQLRVTTGGATATSGEWGKPATNELQGDYIGGQESLARLNDIQNSFKAEYQQALPRAKSMFNAFSEKLGYELSPEEKEFAEGYTTHQRRTADNLSRFIKEMTGAAMSEFEIKRLMKVMPNAGDGIMDGDSPTQFQSKLTEAIRSTKMAIARAEYMHNNGMGATYEADENGALITTGDRAGERIHLRDMQLIMDSRGDALERQNRAAYPAMSDEQIDRMTITALQKEFGLQY
jgi:hypothetical protein